jgi:hypothetical protein
VLVAGVATAIYLLAQDLWTYYHHGDSLVGRLEKKFHGALALFKGVLIGLTIVFYRVIRMSVRAAEAIAKIGTEAGAVTPKLARAGDAGASAGRRIKGGMAGALLEIALMSAALEGLQSIGTYGKQLWENRGAIKGWLGDITGTNRNTLGQNQAKGMLDAHRTGDQIIYHPNGAMTMGMQALGYHGAQPRAANVAHTTVHAQVTIHTNNPAVADRVVNKTLHRNGAGRQH